MALPNPWRPGADNATGVVSQPRLDPRPGGVYAWTMIARRTPLLLIAALATAGCDKKPDTSAPASKDAAPPKQSPKKPSASTQKEAPQESAAPEDVAPAAPKLEKPKHLSAPPADTAKSKSGLAWRIQEAGEGPSGASKTDHVTWHYRSWDPTGRLLFDTYEKGAPKEMKVGRMLPGYAEAIGMMKVGERRRVWIPAKLAHKKRKRVSAAGNRIVDLHLVAWSKALPAPADLKRPPKTAKKSPSGLVTQVLARGKGERSPLPADRVEVKYAGWRQKTGENFDFTGPEETATFGASTVIKGWVEALGTMVVGDKVRVWIPAELAYKGKAGKPQGTLVFDIELVNIHRAGK